MKWLLMVVAFVLGAAITWFLTVRRVSRTLPAAVDAGPATRGPDEDEPGSAGLEPAAPQIVPVLSPGEPVAGAGGPDDDPDPSDVVDEAGFGGTHTPASESLGAAEAWDRDAEDEDALLPKHPGVEPAAEGEVGAAEPVEPTVAVAPVADATPRGDVAGVGAPAVMATVDERVESVETDDTGPASTQAPRARPTQGELTFEAPETSVPPEDRP